MSLDATDEAALRAQGIDKVDCAIVGIGDDFEDAALATASLRAIGVPRVIARAGNEVRIQEVGDGPPLVFIHGVCVAGSSWVLCGP